MKKSSWIKILSIFAACALFTGCAKSQPLPTHADFVPKVGKPDVSIEEQETYKNSLVLDQQWENYGIGDPYIMKYNGLFYLYVSTPYGKTGIKVWTSRNASDWEYAGMVAADRTSTYTAYSPKVMYWNGTFYLYTTPDGNGLHILTGPTPMGPFMDISGVQHPTERVNGQLVPCSCKVHSSIDACLFIDDDGQWYLGHGHANDGIEYHKMLSPTEIDETPYYPGTVIAGNEGNKWTETGEIFKRDNTYYMTFSGNHVANDSYRTNWASSNQPLSGYQLGERPLLTSTEGGQKGTGCGLVFAGADLASDYVVYHNLINPNIGPIRGLNIDRVTYNGGELNAFGPTDFLQEKPGMPTSWWNQKDASAFSDLAAVQDGFGTVSAEKRAFYQYKTGARYVAEMNYNAQGGNAGLYLSYSDAANFARLSVSEGGVLTLTAVNAGVTKTWESAVGGYSASALHTVRAICTEGRLQIYLDGMRKFDVSATLSSGKLGYEFSLGGQAGYTAFTNTEDAQTSREFLSARGKIFAKDFVEEDSAAGLKLTDGSLGGSALTMKERDYARYRVNAGRDTEFAAAVRYRASGNGTLAFLDTDSKILARMSFSDTKGKYIDGALGGIQLAEYYNTVTVAVLEGSLDVESFRLEPSSFAADANPSDLSEEGFTVKDGKWTALGGTIKSYDVSGKAQANAVYGDSRWDDYETSVTIKLDGNSVGRAGLLVRVQNIAPNTGTLHQIFAFNDQSYYVYLDTNGYVGLNKHNYNSTEITGKRIALTPGASYTLKVRAEGNKISVYLDGGLQFTYTDTAVPYLTGKVGLHSESCTASYTNFAITGIRS